MKNLQKVGIIFGINKLVINIRYINKKKIIFIAFQIFNIFIQNLSGRVKNRKLGNTIEQLAKKFFIEPPYRNVREVC